MLRQEAGLDEATAVRTEKVLDQFEPRRRELMKEQHHRMRTLHELLDTDSNDQKAYQEALNGMMSATKEMQELKQREIAALQQVLTPKQQARVMVTLREMRKRAKRMMLEHRGEGRWGGEHPGMGPGPGPGRDGDDEGGDRSDGLF
jgi:Spy/CpxP family protein refolding chaperone